MLSDRRWFTVVAKSIDTYPRFPTKVHLSFIISFNFEFLSNYEGIIDISLITRLWIIQINVSGTFDHLLLIIINII